ncbi:hypothetical protein IQ219_02580 [Synechocystis sp. LEGE 06083]|uniref:hypothetical protein n=1 Tax=Synechocystis sp. LEGE 06083 TaxID=915336 RepID=UPI001880C57E|nr:hypothetical protein [Synechocystis sp. LEGE 06083]MBE9194234.1 hypothetical protein [Synechocystis sp. LEGE 06083]
MLPIYIAQIPQPTVTEVRTAESLGITVGQFYCYAYAMGVRTSDQLTTAFIDHAPESVLIAVEIFTDWNQQGRKDLTQRFIDANLKAQQDICPWESYNYFRSNS